MKQPLDSITFLFNEQSGWDDSGEKNAGPDLDRPSAPLPPMTQRAPGPLPRPAPRPPLPRTLRFGGMESGRSSRLAEPGPGCLSEPCLGRDWGERHCAFKTHSHIENLDGECPPLCAEPGRLQKKSSPPPPPES